MMDVELQVNTEAQVGLFDEKIIHINPESLRLLDIL